MDAGDYLRLANHRMELGDYGGAIAYFGAALRIDPTLDEAYFGRGLVYYQVGDNSAAERDLTSAIKLRPDGPGVAAAYVTRCMARANLGNRKGAIEDYRAVLSLDASLANFLQSQTCVATAQTNVLAMLYPARFAMIVDYLTKG